MRAYFSIFLFAATAMAQPLKGFKVARETFSLELELVVSQLAKDPNISLVKAREITQAAEVINNDIIAIPDANALFLVKSEIYKGLLDNPLVPQKNEVLLNESLVKGIEKKLDKHKLVYTDFSEWLIDSILAELKPFRADNFLDRYQTVSGNDLKERSKALELRKLAKYVSPWLMAFNEKTPEEFNQLGTDVAAGLLRKIASKSYYFKQFASKHTQGGGQALFVVPKLDAQEIPKESLPPSDLDSQSQAQRLDGKSQIDKLDDTELENPSGAIDNLMERQEKVEKGQWKPK